ncbi:MAG: hypothetical protein A2Y56_04215 [Candidatus Aminicenantes bacterium RBG_13_63_10]|nr:MAG: hypothetical protein A2Y56_04215 [Candidatus Aminicenantes bacterium RBG_13_63_10]
MAGPSFFPAKIRRFFLAAALLSLSAPSAPAQGTAARPPLAFSHYKLSNGLQVILAEDFTLPVVSVVVAYRVGSVDDPAGRAGLSYLLENLMFLGSANVDRMQHIGLINRAGGQLSAMVQADRTLFHQTVSSNHLALVLWLESDRMRFLQPNEAKVESSKSSLVEELRQRLSQDVYLGASLAFDHLLYPDQAFGHPVFGLENDLRSISPDEARDFYDAYYVPNNAVLCVCGNINKVRTRELIARYFEGIPRGKEPPAQPRAQKFGKEFRRESFLDPRTQVPAFWLAFRAPTLSPDDVYGLTLLDTILFRGRNSRLFKRLWQKERLVLSLEAGLERRDGLLAYRLFATATNRLMIDKSLRAIFTELQNIKSSFIGPGELDKAKSLFKADYLGRQATTLDKALLLCEAYLNLKRIEDLPGELDKYLQVTPQVLVGLANRYFTQANAIIATVNAR